MTVPQPRKPGSFPPPGEVSGRSLIIGKAVLRRKRDVLVWLAQSVSFLYISREKTAGQTPHLLRKFLRQSRLRMCFMFDRVFQRLPCPLLIPLNPNEIALSALFL
jgi:hypothetical protein